MFCTGRARLTLAVCVAVLALAHGVYAQVNPYQTIENFFKLPEGRKVGSTAGITIDRDGRSIWVFERCGANDCVGSALAPILKFDAYRRKGCGGRAGQHLWIADGRDGLEEIPEEVDVSPIAPTDVSPIAPTIVSSIAPTSDSTIAPV